MAIFAGVQSITHGSNLSVEVLLTNEHWWAAILPSNTTRVYLLTLSNVAIRCNYLGDKGKAAPIIEWDASISTKTGCPNAEKAYIGKFVTVPGMVEYLIRTRTHSVIDSDYDEESDPGKHQGHFGHRLRLNHDQSYLDRETRR